VGRVFSTEPDTDAIAETGIDTDNDIAAADDADADIADQRDADEPFFGMHSEGLVLTGLALGPGLRRAARVCIAAALGLGVLFWLVLVAVYGYRVFVRGGDVNPDMPHLRDVRPWTAYYLVGAVWAVAVGVFGLVTRGSSRRLLWCFGCLVSAFYWPIGMAGSMVLLAWQRRDAAAPRRLVLGALAVLVAAGGSLWRFGAPSDPASAHAIAVGSDGDLLGTWHSRTGMSVELRGDGTYDASALSGGGLGSGDGVPASSGRWDSEALDGYSGVRLEVDGDLAQSLVFDVYRAGPDLLLCATDDPAHPCRVVLRRA